MRICFYWEVLMKLRNIMKCFLPLLFIAYLGGITLFTHSHVVNGVIIVHSHPFKASMSIQRLQLETIFYLASFRLFFPSVASGCRDGFPCFVVCTEHSYHGMHQVCKASWRYLPACSPFFFSNPID